MNFKLIAAVLVLALAAGGAGVYFVTSEGEQSHSSAKSHYEYSKDTSLSWSYWLGNMDSPGVSDAKTPVSQSEMTELWKISDTVNSTSTNWKVPGSAICIGDKTYFFRGSDNTLNCVITSTGETVAKTQCASGSVYNMALAYGDGKIFVPILSGSATVMHAYDAKTLKQLFISEPVRGGEVQGPITYYEGRVYFGTYDGDFACFGSEDTDTSKNNEVVSPIWIVRGNGWYNMTPAFFEDYCVIAEKGYDIDGAVAYSVEISTGAVNDKIAFDMDYCVSGIAAYEGRAYIAFNTVTNKADATSEMNSNKILTIRSFPVRPDGTFNKASEKVWASSVKDGGTQSAPMILNNRLYIGGGGSTMGTAEPFTVINIAGDGTMSLAYRADSLKTKGTASITTAYATANNGYAVYIYLIEYGKVLPGEDSDSPIGTADIFVLRDSVGQTNADIVFRLTPSVPQFAYQSFTVSPEGYLLVRNDSTLFCYGPRTPVGYTHSDVENAIDLALSFASKGSANSAQVKKIEERYAALNTSDKSKVSNYDRLQDLYCNVTFVIGSERVTEKAVKGSIISAPNAEVPNGKTLVGWGTGSGTWKFATDKANGDLTLTAILEDAATVSFNSAGGSSVNSISVKKGSVMGYVKDPERSGYTFGGWFSGNTRYTPQYSVVSSSITLTAKWLKNSMMSFDTDGGSSAGAINVTYSKAVGTLPMISKSGYRFEGWYYNETKYTESTIYSYESGITLKAKWSQNTSTVLNNGKGMTVTGTMPDSASINIRVPYTGPGSLTEPIKAAAGNSDMDFVMITISGDGIDKSQGFEMSVPVGSGNNGKTIDVYYYLDSGVKKASVTVSGGVLKVTLYGESGGGGVQIIFGLAKGTGIMSHV